MRALMGLIKNRHGTYYAQQKVPQRLQSAVARVRGIGQERQTFLKRSLGTKDLKTANVRAKPVLSEFDRILAAAEALQKATPIVDRLSEVEIDRMAEYVFASELDLDDQLRTGGRERIKWISAREGWANEIPSGHLEQLPEFGLSIAQLEGLKQEVADSISDYQDALARADISAVQDHIADALDTFGINLSRTSPSFPRLGLAVLRAYVRALKAIEQRNEGVPIATPPLTNSKGLQATGGGTLKQAFEGWKKVKTRPARTHQEYNRAVELFIQLHGDMAVADIKKSHVLRFREALQDTPRQRMGALLKATLPGLSTWGKAHPSAAKIGAATVNKILGAVQAVAVWAGNNGLVPDDVTWADPFARMRIEADNSERTAFEVNELRSLFAAPVFTKHEYPQGARGAAGFWLPLLGLFTGARQGELASLRVADVKAEGRPTTSLLYITAQASVGKRLKTEASQRVVPVHAQLVELGFVRFVESVRKSEGDAAWLFPLIAPDQKGAQPAWSKWFGRYLRSHGVTDTAKVFHSFRHNFKDALRQGKVDHELRENLIGHAHDSTVSGGYGAKNMLQRWGVAVLSDAINCISYPGLDLSRVKPMGEVTATSDTKRTKHSSRKHHTP